MSRLDIFSEVNNKLWLSEFILLWFTAFSCVKYIFEDKKVSLISRGIKNFFTKFWIAHFDLGLGISSGDVLLCGTSNLNVTIKAFELAELVIFS